MLKDSVQLKTKKVAVVRNFNFKSIHIISVLIIVIVVHTVMISVVSKRQLSGVNPSVPIR